MLGIVHYASGISPIAVTSTATSCAVWQREPEEGEESAAKRLRALESDRGLRHRTGRRRGRRGSILDAEAE